MAANDQIQATVQILRQTRARDRILVVGPQDYSDLDETSPATQTFINGGNPGNQGRLITSADVFNPGERMVIQLKNYMGSAKTLDSTGSTSGKFLIGVYARDLNTGKGYHKYLTEADRSTAELADDGSMANAIFTDAYQFVVPDGERWDLHGKWQADFRTTA